MSKYKVTATKTTTGMQVSAGTRGLKLPLMNLKVQIRG